MAKKLLLNNQNKNMRSEQDTIEFDVLAHFLLAFLLSSVYTIFTNRSYYLLLIGDDDAYPQKT